MSAAAVLKFSKEKKSARPTRGCKTYIPIPEKGRGGTVLEVLACCVSLLPGKNKAALSYFLQTLSPCFY